DHAIAPAFDELRCEQAHEAGQADEVDVGGAQAAVELGIECEAIPVGAMIDHVRGKAEHPGMTQTGGLGIVGHDERDLRRSLRRAAGLDQRLHVAAAPGDENRGPQARQALSISWIRQAGAPSRRATIVPTRWTCSPAAVSSALISVASADPTTATMPRPQLKTRAISA